MRLREREQYSSASLGELGSLAGYARIVERVDQLSRDQGGRGQAVFEQIIDLDARMHAESGLTTTRLRSVMSVVIPPEPNPWHYVRVRINGYAPEGTDLRLSLEGRSLSRVWTNADFEAEEPQWETFVTQGESLDFQIDLDAAAEVHDGESDAQSQVYLGIRIEQTDLSRCGLADVAEPRNVLDFDDVYWFMSSFVSGEHGADVAPPFGVHDAADVIGFLDLFEQGCQN